MALSENFIYFSDLGDDGWTNRLGNGYVFLLSMSDEMFTWNAFISGALLSAIPGIILQLTLIPAIMVMLDKTGLVPYRKAASTRT